MRKTILILTAAALPLALAACSSGDKPSSAAAAATTTVVAPAGATTSQSAPASTSAPAKAACDLKADLNTQPDGGIAMLALTNQGSEPCSLRGWAGVSFLGADNSPVDVKVSRVDQPGRGTQITLKKGQTAFAGLKWQSCDKGDAACKVITTVQITPPGASKPVVADFIGANGGNEKVTELALSSAQIGTLQPAAEGVVAW